MTTREIKRTLRLTEKVFGLPRGWLYKIAMVESNLNPKAVNSSTRAAGLFQYLPATASEEHINPFHVAEAACATAKRIARFLHVIPTTRLVVMYLMHQQGAKGVSEILATEKSGDPLTPARLRNMRANLPKLFLEQFDAAGSDQEKAAIFIRAWEQKLG